MFLENGIKQIKMTVKMQCCGNQVKSKNITLSFKSLGLGF